MDNLCVSNYFINNVNYVYIIFFSVIVEKYLFEKFRIVL